ncbi:MAG: mechanosensitive ion channel [Gammaproteobacteria bacterium]|nr:mechanosensitive ion channel [Gammaproteobacteria bacterium]
MGEYQTLLVKTTGELTTDVIDVGVVNSLMQDWWLESKSGFRNNAVEIIFKAFLFILILLIAKALALLVTKMLESSFQSSRAQKSQLLEHMLHAWTNRIIMFMGLLIALAQVGVSLGPVLAGLGVAGFIIGFALQDTLGNFASGVMILIYRPFDEGDLSKRPECLAKCHE